MKEVAVKKGLKDTAKTSDVLAAFAKLIINRMGGDVKKYDLKRLQAIADGSDARDYISVEFERVDGRACCSLYVNIRCSDFFYDRRGRDAETGDDFYIYQGSDIEVKFSWPSHGTDELSLNLTRLRLYNDVAAVATELQAHAQVTREFVSPGMTAAERAVNEEKAAKAKLEKAVAAGVENVRKNMRIGAERSPVEFAGVPTGEYTVKVEDKEYFASVFAGDENNSVGLVRRVA